MKVEKKQNSPSPSPAPLRITVRIPGDLVGDVLDYASLAGFGDDVPELVLAALARLVKTDRDFRKRRGEVGKGGEKDGNEEV